MKKMLMAAFAPLSLLFATPAFAHEACAPRAPVFYQRTQPGFGARDGRIAIRNRMRRRRFWNRVERRERFERRERAERMRFGRERFEREGRFDRD